MSGKQCHSNYLFYVGTRASLGIGGASLRLAPALHTALLSEDRAIQLTSTEDYVKFRSVVFDICQQSDRQTYTQAQRNTLHPNPTGGK